MEIHWKDLIVNEKDKQKESIWSFRELEEIEFRCQLCGKPFKLQGRVFKRRFDKDGYFRRAVFACQSKECTHKKKSIVAKSAAVREGQARGAITASAMRKGKTFEELYGIEEAEKKLAKIRAARAAQTGTEHDPRLGKKHSISAKKKMSDRKKELLQSEEKKYSSRVSDELLTFRQYCEETLMLTNNLGNKYKWGEYKNWFFKDLETYDSSYELAFMLKAEVEKTIYKKNTKFRLEYKCNGEKHYYIPDFFIYDAKEPDKLISIIEVKAIHIKKNEDSMQNLKAKMRALKQYCNKNGLQCSLIFEKDLGKTYLRKALKFHEDKKDNARKIE